MHSLVLPEEWSLFLQRYIRSEAFKNLSSFVTAEYESVSIFPDRDAIFKAFTYVSPSDVKVVILGQDPYHDIGQAHGLSFSVQGGVKLPPTLKNIFKELESDYEGLVRPSGDLTSWAHQGVLLINSVLTVEAHKPLSHKNKGWEGFTDYVLQELSLHNQHIIFVLWGNYAKSKRVLIDETRHLVISSAHPSPLSAYNGFFGSKPFSRINAYLALHGKGEIKW